MMHIDEAKVVQQRNQRLQKLLQDKQQQQQAAASSSKQQQQQTTTTRAHTLKSLTSATPNALFTTLFRFYQANIPLTKSKKFSLCASTHKSQTTKRKMKGYRRRKKSKKNKFIGGGPL